MQPFDNKSVQELTGIMRIAILHNDADIIRLFSYLISELGFDTCWSSDNAEDIKKLCKDDLPDLLLIQLNLKNINVSTLIKDIMNTSPTTIIVINEAIKNNSGEIFSAMSAGALDAFTEPSSKQPSNLNELKHKILNIKKLHDGLNRIDRVKITDSIKDAPLVAIGASSGGPAALLTILKQLPENTQAVWVIIQHMDHQFSQGMAQWLNEQINITVEVAIDNQPPKLGHVYIACSNDHLIINASGCFEYTDIPLDYPYRPSVDVFFESAVTHWPNKLIGVLLTGMGRDGANGLLSFYNRGMFTIAQNKESCAVHGMPRAACELKAVTIELDIHKIADEILKHIPDIQISKTKEK